MNQNALLKRLYTLKSFGFSYIDDNLGSSLDGFDCFKKLGKQLNSCNLCELCKTKKSSFYAHDKNKILIIQENPYTLVGENGDIFGSNKALILKKLLIEVGIFEISSYTFLIKCLSNQNKFINANSISNCAPYLFDEIKLTCPSIVITMGERATTALLGEIAPLCIVHGTIFRSPTYAVMPTHDISYVIKNPSKFNELKDDLSKITSLI